MTVDQNSHIRTEPIEAPPWVHQDADRLTGTTTDWELHGFRVARTILWQSGVYDLPDELVTEGLEIAAECAALLPLIERVAARWVEFDRTVQVHFSDLPSIDQLNMPISFIPERRMAAAALEAIGDATNCEHLAKLSYVPEASR